MGLFLGTLAVVFLTWLFIRLLRYTVSPQPDEEAAENSAEYKRRYSHWLIQTLSKNS